MPSKKENSRINRFFLVVFAVTVKKVSATPIQVKVGPGSPIQRENITLRLIKLLFCIEIHNRYWQPEFRGILKILSARVLLDFNCFESTLFTICSYPFSILSRLGPYMEHGIEHGKPK